MAKLTSQEKESLYQNSINSDEKVMDYLMTNDQAMWEFFIDNPDLEVKLCSYVRNHKKFGSEFAEYVNEFVEEASHDC